MYRIRIFAQYICVSHWYLVPDFKSNLQKRIELNKQVPLFSLVLSEIRIPQAVLHRSWRQVKRWSNGCRLVR